MKHKQNNLILRSQANALRLFLTSYIIQESERWKREKTVKRHTATWTQSQCHAEKISSKLRDFILNIAAQDNSYISMLIVVFWNLFEYMGQVRYFN